MNHLDEGTIHAWLDGALDATRARDAEAHVAQCAACSAAVAEARGLIAGSSRILNALDDVPSGVTPKRAPVAPARPAKRMWRAAPWVTGIAALFLGAVILRTPEMRRDATERASPLANQALLVDTSPVAAAEDQSTAAPQTQLAKVPVPEATTAARRADGRSNPEPQRQVAPPARRVAEGAGSGRAAVGGQVAGVTASSVPTADATAPATPAQLRSATVPRASSPGVAVVTGMRDERALDKVADVRAAAPPTVLQRRDGVVAPDPEPFVGCYRTVAPPGERGFIPSVSAAAGAAAANARARGAAAPAAAKAEFTQSALPAVVRLDTTVAAPGFAVRSATSDSIIGSWEIVRDSARVELLTRGRFTFAPTVRVTCPER